MEHRWSPRKMISANTVISLRNLPILAGKCLNLSRGGMFVSTGKVYLPTNCNVDVELEYQQHHLRLPAVVVHHSRWGMGLMFENLQGSTQKLLQEFLNRPEMSAAAHGATKGTGLP